MQAGSQIADTVDGETSKWALQQAFSWNDLKKGLNKAAKIGKKVVSTASQIAHDAAPVLAKAAEVGKELAPEYAKQIDQGLDMYAQGADAVD